MIDWLLCKISNDSKRRLQSNSIGVGLQPPGHLLKAVKVVNEVPLRQIGFSMCVGQMSKATKGWLQKFVISRVLLSHLEEDTDAVGLTDGHLEGLVPDGQVGDDSGCDDDDRLLIVTKKLNQFECERN